MCMVKFRLQRQWLEQSTQQIPVRTECLKAHYKRNEDNKIAGFSEGYRTQIINIEHYINSHVGEPS